jgi:hypothetical protein
MVRDRGLDLQADHRYFRAEPNPRLVWLLVRDISILV